MRNRQCDVERVLLQWAAFLRWTGQGQPAEPASLTAIPEGVIQCSNRPPLERWRSQKTFLLSDASFVKRERERERQRDGWLYGSAPCDFARAPLRKRSTMAFHCRLTLFSRRRAAAAIFALEPCLQSKRVETEETTSFYEKNGDHTECDCISIYVSTAPNRDGPKGQSRQS